MYDLHNTVHIAGCCNQVAVLCLTVLCLLCSFAASQKGCHFPESDVKPFIFNVGSAATNGTKIVDTRVEPDDATIEIASTKSKNLPNVNYDGAFHLEKTGQNFVISVARSLALPPYPSSVTENTVFLTINCNGESYPLITIQIRHQNQFPPEFYGKMPYKLSIDPDLPVGSVIDSPVFALDQDPSSEYSVTYKIEDGDENKFFEIANKNDAKVKVDDLPEALQKSLLPDQFPPILQLVLLKSLHDDENPGIFDLYISASDAEIPPLTSYASLKIEVGAGAKNPISIIRPKSQTKVQKADLTEDKIGVRIPILEQDSGLAAAEPEAHTLTLNRKPVSAQHREKLQEPKLEKSFSVDLNFDDTPTTVLDYDEAATLVTVPNDVSATTEITTPRFQSSVYEFVLPENLQSSVFGGVKCVDQALVHRPLLYSLFSSHDTDKFAIANETGVLTTLLPLDYELNKTYNFQVSCCFTQGPANCDYANVTLQVIDLNDNSPQFEKNQYNVEIPIDTPVGTVITTVKASDKDSNENGKVVYRLKNGLDLFKIDSETGTIRLAVPLSRLSNLSIIVEASDNDYPVRRNTTQINLRVHSTNPSAPVFDQPRYEVTRFAPIPAGSILVTLHATDPDPGPDGQILYQISRIESINPKDDLLKFSINALTGQLSANVRLAAKDETPTVIIVEAVDQSPDYPRKSETVVKLNLIAERTEKISFYPLPKRIFLSTYLRPGSVVLRMSTSYTEAPQLFTLTESSGTDFFQMVGDELQVKKKLKEGVYNVTMRVDAGTAFAEHQLTIVVMVDREKYPVFPRLTYDLQIPVNVTYPALLHTFDAVLFVGHVQYSIYPRESAPKGLILDPISGKLSATHGFVEAFSNYQPMFVVIRATNRNFPKYFSDVGVILHISEAPAKFYFSRSLYQFTIPANTPAGTILKEPLILRNRTEDEGVEYIVQPADIISIEPNGTIKTLVSLDSGELRFNLSRPVDLTVYAKSGQSEATTKVRLVIESVQKLDPKFEYDYYETAINENAEPGEVIGIVRLAQIHLKKYTNITYEITEGDREKVFEITTEGFLMRSEIGNLDRETKNFYNLTVEAFHQKEPVASTKVSINVADANDNLPQLKSTMIWNITEGASSVGAKLLLNATDADLGENGTLSFSLVPSTASDHFSISQRTIQTAELLIVKPLSHDEASRIVLEVNVKDMGSPSLNTTSTVIVNVAPELDQAPIFTSESYNANVTTKEITDAPILRIEAQTLPSSGNLTYKIIAGPLNMFSIDNHTGEIRFASNLSEWMPGLHKLTVEADNGYGSSSVSVVISIPENFSVEPDQRTTEKWNSPPVFEKGIYEFVFNVGKEGEIGQVHVTDPDGDDVEFSIEPRIYNSLFTIDHKSGVIGIRHALDKKQYGFLVVATDNGSPPQKSFTNVAVSLASTEKGTTDIFQIPPLFEATTVTKKMENLQSTTANLEAMDTTVKISENVETTTMVSLDLKVATTFEPSSISETAVASTEFYGSTVAEQDSHKTTESILVTDITSAAPLLTAKETALEYSEQSTMASTSTETATQFLFSDEKTTSSSTLLEAYTLTSTSYDETVAPQAVTESTSELPVSSELEMPSSTVSDANTPPVVVPETTTYATTTQVCIFNPEKPVEQIIVATKAMSKAESVYTIGGICDCQEGCSVEFQLANEKVKPFASVSPDGSILVDPDSLKGLLGANVLDELGRLPLLVEIKTGGRSLEFLLYIIFDGMTDFAENKDTAPVTTVTELPSAETTVTIMPDTSEMIELESVRFEHEIYTAVTPEGTYKSGTVLSMKPDQIKVVLPKKDKSIAFYLAGEEQNLPFYIKNDTAEVIIFGTVDHEQRSQYDFDVIAVDDSDPPHIGRTHVKVQILDVNDNSPQFQNSLLAIPVLRNTPVDKVIGVFNATDADEGASGEVRYSLYNDTDIFSISEKTGELSLQKSLQDADVPVYYTAVVASDMGKPASKSTHNFRIEVFDENQVGPQFREKRYSATVKGDAAPGTVILQVVAGIGSYTYHLSDTHSGLFEINNAGVLRLGGTPMKLEQNLRYMLNVTAKDDSGNSSTVEVEVFIEGGILNATTTTAPKKQCMFSSKQYNTEIYENQSGRHKLLKLASNCEDENHKYMIMQGSGEFEINSQTGELWAIEPLDREKRSLHFIIVSIVESKGGPSREKKQANSVIEYLVMKAKLKTWQTLVTVHVLDQNDNKPHFVKQNTEGIYVYSVDWQAPLLTPIARIHAEDADEKNTLYYYITDETKDSATHFTLNETTGVISLTKTLINTNKDVFEFNVMVSDGAHNVTSPVKIYKLSPDNNVVLIAINKDRQEIEDWILERKVSDELGVKFNILVKQPYVDDNERVDPQRTHLFVYACDEDTSVPLEKDVLKNILEKNRGKLSSELPGMLVFLPSVNSSPLASTAEIILIAFCVFLLLTACCTFLYILKCCKGKNKSKISDSDYMVDSHSAGPRPYNVNEIDRKTAQSVLSSRPLPNPYETKEGYDAQMRSSSAFSNSVKSIDAQRRGTPASNFSDDNKKQNIDIYTVSGPRSKNFSGNVEQVHTLVKKQLKSRKPNGEQDYRIDEALFPVYRFQGYEHP